MLKNGHQHPNLFHLAGIVPVASQKMDFGMDWSDCLMPIAPDFTAVENAVLECAWAGCETIWIICNDDVSPLIRYRIGDFLMDPVYFNRFDVHPSENKRRIPVFTFLFTIETEEEEIVWHGALFMEQLGVFLFVLD